MRSIKTLICIFTVSSVMICSLASADDKLGRRDESQGIIGTWQVEVTVRFNAPDCTTSEPVPFGPNPFPSLNTFHVGGTMSETGSRSPPSRRSPGHGVWERKDRRNYQSLYTFQSFDENGFLAANANIRSDIRLAADGNSFLGVSRLAFTDISGNVMQFCATLDAVRFEL